MAASAGGLDGEKICEVAGTVKWTSIDCLMKSFEPGSIALYKLSSSFYIHATVTRGRPPRRVKFLLKQDRFNVSTRQTRLSLSIPNDIERKSSGVTISVQEANPKQLSFFLDYLNFVKNCGISAKGKLSTFSPLKESSIQDRENQPCNSDISATPPRVPLLSPLRKSLNKLTHSTLKNTPSLATNYHAKQMNPPSSFGTQKTKSPLHDRTFASANITNTSSARKSASSFYGSQQSALSLSERNTEIWNLGPGKMPPKQPRNLTFRLASQISFRCRDKQLFESEVTLTGFSNLGNTCYMNAILQSLFGVPPFVQDLSNKSLLEKVHPQCLYKCLYGVLCCKKKNGNPEALKNSLRKLKRTISEAATRFSGYHQHDAHEFLCQVFEQLKDDVSSCSSPSSSSREFMESLCPVTKTFECGVMHTISCKQCGESVPKEEVYHAFSLDIPTLCSSPGNSPFGAVNMQTLLEKYFQDEELEYTCSRCECKEAVISHSFCRLPRVLILHLKRYGYDNTTEEQAKKQDKISIERFIDLRKLCNSKTEPPLEFHSSCLKLSPLKSRQKPQKRHLSEDDNDDASDFCPSPPVRRKLDESFLNTLMTRNGKVASSKGSLSSFDAQVNGSDSSSEFNAETNLATLSDEDNITDSGTDDKENSEHIHRNIKAVWEASEEEQMKWALAESAKSVEKQSDKASNSQSEKDLMINANDVQQELVTTEHDKCLTSSSAMCDVVTMVIEDNASNETGLKGGAPITETFRSDQDNDNGHLLCSGSKEPNTVQRTSGGCAINKSPVVLKNSPILCTKRSNGFTYRKKKELNTALMHKQPVLTKFDGNLLENSTKEETFFSTSDISARNWHGNSSRGFRRRDIETAISMSLEDQEANSKEDHELNRALELSLQEYADKPPPLDQPMSPAEVIDIDNITDSSFQDEAYKLSTHAYRLVSIVSHIGSRSTSGHYISDVYDCKTKQWTSYDDSTATKVSEHGVRYKRQETGYIFFYLYKQCVDTMESSSPRKPNSQR